MSTELSGPKRMVLLNRKRDSSLDQFFAYWAGPHARIACKLPGVCRYIQNRVAECLWRDGGPQADGIVELWFKDAQVIQTAAASEVGIKHVPADERNFLSGITLVNVRVEGPQEASVAAKVILVGKTWPKSEGRLDSLKQAAGSSLLASACNWAEKVYGREGLDMQPEIDVLVTFWFDNAATARKLFAATTTRQDIGRHFQESTAYLVDPLNII